MKPNRTAKTVKHKTYKSYRYSFKMWLLNIRSEIYTLYMKSRGKDQSF